MNARIIALAALVASAPAAASAQAEEGFRWSIGAGFSGIGEVFLVGPSSATVFGVFNQGASVPVATVFLERRLGEKSWLVFAGAGNLQRDRFDPPPDTGLGSLATVTELDAGRASLSVGLRRVVTRPGAIVDLSVLGSLGGGYVHVRQELATGAARSEVEDTGGFANATMGIAVERALTGALGLRISTPLVGLSWSRLDRKDGAGTRAGASAGVSVVVAPRIELRLAF